MGVERVKGAGGDRRAGRGGVATMGATEFGTLGERRRRGLYQVGRGGMGAHGGFIQTVC